MLMVGEGGNFLMMRRVVVAKNQSPSSVHIVEAILIDDQYAAGPPREKGNFEHRGVDDHDVSLDIDGIIVRTELFLEVGRKDDRGGGKGFLDISHKFLHQRTADRIAVRVFCHWERSWAYAYQSKYSASSPNWPASNRFKKVWVLKRCFRSKTFSAFL